MKPIRSTGAPREIELKFELEPRHVEMLKALPALTNKGGKSQNQRSIYFDTAKEKLRKVGLALRVRQTGKRFVQTVKGGNRNGTAMFDRDEWEQQITGPEPDVDALADTPAGKLLRGSAKPLVPICAATVSRTLWQVAHGNSEIEIVLDEGEIVADGKHAPILEVELELKSGSPRALFALAYELGASVPLRLGVLAKNERGYLLREGALDNPVKAAPVPLSRDMTAGAAFQAIAGACIRQLRLNEPLFVHHRHSGALHQTRVALRRLRSAFSMFGPIIADERGGHIREGLRWISICLGEARDLDVFLATRFKQGEVSSEAHAAVLAERDRAFDKAIAALESPRFRALMLDLVEWLAMGSWREEHQPASARRDQPVARFAEEVLDRFWRRVKKRGRGLAGLADQPRHEVRIAAKKLRYGSEFFAPLYARGTAARQHKRFVATLEQMQDHLGQLNDIVTARVLSERFPGLAAARSDPDRDELLAASEKAHARLIELGPFWR